jgi:hypothetical protein
MAGERQGAVEVKGGTPKACRPLADMPAPFTAIRGPLGKGLIDFTMKEPKAEKMS